MEIKTLPMLPDKYENKAIRFYDKGTHCELIFTDDFNLPSSGQMHDGIEANTLITDIVTDLRRANKDKEIHIFVSSFGGYVIGLNMFLQELMQFKHRVGINIGTACSCGFMLLAYCEELYTSPFAEFMYHSMFSVNGGKVTEVKKRNEFDEKLWKLIVQNSYVNEMLTPDELKLAETSEVWLTGADLINRGVAADYTFYNYRNFPLYADNEFYVIGNEVYRQEGQSFVKYVKEKSTKKEPNEYSYCYILNKLNMLGLEESDLNTIEEIPEKPESTKNKSKSKKTKTTKTETESEKPESTKKSKRKPKKSEEK